MDRTAAKERPSTRTGRNTDGGEDTGGQVAHTLTACVRCRHRKTRCDPGLPRCTPCQKNNAICEYFDAAKGKKMPRHYVVHLQERVRQLEHELASLRAGEPQAKNNIDSVGRGVGVKIKEGDEYPRFLGPASGIAMTRLVLEMARDLWDAKSIREIITEQKHLELKAKYETESAKPTSKVYPLISFVAAPGLPSQELTEQLVHNYNLKTQYLYPVLHEPSFNIVVKNIFNGGTDPYENFAVRLVIAISMQKLDSTYAGLADSYYLAALPFLDKVLIKKDLGTLQCLLLIAIYSMTTPTRTAAYWVVGLATKLCQELRITEEATIGIDENDQPLDPLAVDMRRRCYWISLSFELGMAHILGRPSSFAMTYNHPNVRSWLQVDDVNITKDGVKPGSPAVMKKRISTHFALMRLLQLEIRHVLYVRRRKTPVNDTDPWFLEMERKLYDWMNDTPRQDEGSGMSESWFRGRMNTMLVFMFRPSPQVPEPSIRAAEQCFEASRYNIHMQKQQIENKSIDVTWIFGQSLFMAINTILWTLSYPSIRKAHPRSEVEQHLQTALEGIYLVSLKWPGVESALELYTTLADTCLKAYEHDVKPVRPVFNTATTPPAQVQQLSPPPTNDIKNQATIQQVPYQLASPISLAPEVSSPSRQPQGNSITNIPPLSITAQMSRSQPQSQDRSPIHYASPIASIPTAQHTRPPTSNPYQSINISPPQPAYNNSYTQPNPITFNVFRTPVTTAEQINFNTPAPIYSNPLPDPMKYGLSPTAVNSMMERGHFYGSLQDPYAQLLHAEYFDPGQLQGLNLEQQSELLGNLEASRLNAEFMYGQRSQSTA